MADMPCLQPAPGILIVDDVPANLELLAEMLRERGYEPRPVPGGRLALQAAHAEPPDLILLDINMPEMSGFEVCELLKADAALKDIPVIFITAFAETEDKVKAFALGGVDYITKPFQAAEVAARVRTHLEIHRQRRELERNYVRLSEFEKLKETLVHMIIHDLRNPLAVIRGSMDVVMQREAQALTADSRKFMNAARAVTATLAEMISSILDVGRMEAGAMTLRLVPCDVVAIARAVLASVEPLRGRRELTVEAPAASVAVTADSDILLRVLQNLVDNALKFTPPSGWIRLAIAAEGGFVRVAVQDNGPGIPEEYQRTIFDKFGQVPGFERQVRYATGLGLAFCKMAVDAHGGRIGVESREGAGSTFWFELPLLGAPAEHGGETTTGGGR
jgi:two-component system sensor histidine kinase/response regulator